MQPYIGRRWEVNRAQRRKWILAQKCEVHFNDEQKMEKPRELRLNARPGGGGK